MQDWQRPLVIDAALLHFLDHSAGVSDGTHAGTVGTSHDPCLDDQPRVQPGRASWRQARPPKKNAMSDISDASLEQQAAMLAGLQHMSICVAFHARTTAFRKDGIGHRWRCSVCTHDCPLLTRNDAVRWAVLLPVLQPDSACLLWLLTGAAEGSSKAQLQGAIKPQEDWRKRARRAPG